MYNNFFGFKERPFQLVPNPGYLFLSRSHEEAMAHLTYAISHGDGFVSITGEVGTGKTTLCRAFLENLEDNTEVAYIFNPQLDALGLLRAINDEFGLSSAATNNKDLIDSLNAFLIEKKAQKKNVLLLVDEAQNLGKEVLEQLRLLSNLETNTSKLLQIILVGQPELQNLLDSFELRQLRQRITLSWFLTPLSFRETREYIRHRVNIAAQKTEDRFSNWAYYHIYKYSRGIPRLINIACDRGLLTAFGLNRRKVTGSIGRASIKELNARGGKPRGLFTPVRVATAAVILLCLVLLGLYLLTGSKGGGPGPAAATQSPPAAAASAVVPARTPAPDTKAPRTLADFPGTLATVTNRSSRLAAIRAALAPWKTAPRLDSDLNTIEDDRMFFQFAAAQNGFNVLALGRDLELIKKLNLPAVLEFTAPGATTPRYLTIIKISGGEFILNSGEKGDTIGVTAADLQSYWTGAAFIPWKNFYNFQGDIPIDAPAESVFTFKMLLRDMGYADVKPGYIYDDLTRDIVRQIQEKHGIEVDGIVGTQTKIVIYNEKKDLDIPLLQPPTAGTIINDINPADTRRDSAAGQKEQVN